MMDENTILEMDGEGDERDQNGRFRSGWKGGPGAPPGGQQSRFRAKLLASIQGEDIDTALKVIRETMNDPHAKARDRLAAAALLLDRACGKVSDPDLQELIAQAESLLANKEDR